jgi:hypothetical protein
MPSGMNSEWGCEEEGESLRYKASERVREGGTRRGKKERTHPPTTTLPKWLSSAPSNATPAAE